jgi:hypothetical protein
MHTHPPYLVRPRRRLAPIALLAALTLTAGACVGDIGGPSERPHIQTVRIDAGADQTGIEHEVLPVPITAQVLLSDGSKDAAHVVRAEIVSGGGAITLGGASAGGNGASLSGAGDGRITVVWTLGAAGEEQRLRFSTSGESLISTDVTATAVPATR